MYRTLFTYQELDDADKGVKRSRPASSSCSYGQHLDRCLAQGGHLMAIEGLMMEITELQETRVVTSLAPLGERRTSASSLPHIRTEEGLRSL